MELPFVVRHEIFHSILPCPACGHVGKRFAVQRIDRQFTEGCLNEQCNEYQIHTERPADFQHYKYMSWEKLCDEGLQQLWIRTLPATYCIHGAFSLEQAADSLHEVAVEIMQLVEDGWHLNGPVEGNCGYVTTMLLKPHSDKSTYWNLLMDIQQMSVDFSEKITAPAEQEVDTLEPGDTLELALATFPWEERLSVEIVTIKGDEILGEVITEPEHIRYLDQHGLTYKSDVVFEKRHIRKVR